MQRAALKEERRRVRKLKLRVENLSKEGVEVDSDSHEDLLAIMKENSEKVVAKYPDNSFARLFWSQQLKAAQQKSSKSMRWHPVMVRWCIYLRHISGKGYNLLRDSGCISLPSQRTLRDYTYYNKACTGFSAGTDEELVRLLQGCEEWQKIVLLLLDEMYIKEDIVYNKHTGRIVGFTDLGDVNNHLLRYDLVVLSTPVMGKSSNFYLTDWRGLQLVNSPLRLLQRPCSPSWSVAFVQIWSTHMHNSHALC